jgi:lipopolysaccharide/colanic/teichoic acid biosynthesis glycosyltransferase
VEKRSELEMRELSISAFMRLLWRSQVHTLIGVTFGLVFALLLIFGTSTQNFMQSSPELWVWLILTCGVGMSITHALGYFNVFRIFPRKSDLFILLISIPAAALFVTLIQRWIFGLGVVHYSTSIWSGIFAAVTGYITHYFGSAVRSKFGPKRRVMIEALPSEKELLIKVLTSLGMNEAVKILSKHELKQHLIRAAHSSIDLIIISRQAVKHFEEDGVLIRAHLAGIPIVDIKTVICELTGRIRLEDSDLWSYVLGATPQTAALRTFGALKMVIEPLVAFCMAFILSPIMIALSIWIKSTSKGPILYRQTRTGYLGRTFTLVKFRSMHSDAETNGPQWASQNDCRITPVGSFLRRTRLDELPQLLNVIRGEMSFFGPRPERPEIYHELKKEIPLFSMRTIVRPGISGWAQVLGGYAASVEESLAKLEYDLYYIQNMSPRLDLIILIKTLQVALFGDSKPRMIELPELAVVAENGPQTEMVVGS